MSAAQTSHFSTNCNDDIREAFFSKRRCCFCFPFLNTQPSSRSRSVFWERIDPVDACNPTTSTRTNSSPGAWWAQGWKKMREWSEIVAGPKWKTLIRKIGKKRSKNAGYGNGKFRYDPLSYALNFDEGLGQHDYYDEDIVGRGFSSRYSLPPSCNTSLDFDKEGIVLL